MLPVHRQHILNLVQTCLTEDNLTGSRSVGIKEAFSIILIFFLLQFSIIAVGAAIFGSDGSKASISLVGTILSVVAALLVGPKIAGKAFFDSGIYCVGFARISKRNVLGSIVLGVLTGGIVTYLTFVFPHAGSSAQAPTDMFLNNGWGVVGLWLIVVVLFAPLGEELVFRGLILPVVIRKLGIPLGALTSTVAFLLIHLPQIDGYFVASIGIFALGMFSAIVRIYSGSLFASILFHSCYNLVPLLVVLRAKLMQ